MSKIILDKEKCIGCGSCAAVCSDFFEMGPDSKSHLKDSTDIGEGKEELKTDNSACAADAKSACPAEAIDVQ